MIEQISGSNRPFGTVDPAMEAPSAKILLARTNPNGRKPGPPRSRAARGPRYLPAADLLTRPALARDATSSVVAS